MHGTAQRQAHRNQPADSIRPATVQGLTFQAGGQKLLDGIDLALDRTGTTAIMGPNGAGKSLLLRLLHGLLTPSAGTVRWNGRAPDRTVRRQQAMVFQKPVLLRRSVIANVVYALKVHGLPRSQRRQRAAEALADAGLYQLARRPARVLSGGEQQRLALARAWATRPEVLFLDEPTANLDPAGAHAVERMVAEIKNRGTKIVLTTHDLGQARRLADEVVFLHRGHLIERSPAQTFFDQPQSAQARAFLSGDLVL
ncbi:phosphate ABC transporter ATP-binding protein [Rhodovibrio salinarum]|uniref:Phosphate ABC transporter ATP-binding protein n=2 Tax=Rhodovibrio salinarum TaxID=1087 RepID=A0A934QK90_9PROT|nr:phosphate ABC transporter ATP-binding protein [Rhodovibrio salinarum]